MNIFSKQRNFINRKAIFFFATQNKNETVALNAKDKKSRGYINDELSRTDNIANNASNVNNNETKFSLDVNFSYNELIKKPYIKKAMLIGIAKNSVNEPFVVSFIVNKHTNEIQSIDVLYAVNAKNKGNNDDTANAKALASTSETSVGNVPFNSSISKYSDNVKKFSLDVGRFSND